MSTIKSLRKAAVMTAMPLNQDQVSDPTSILYMDNVSYQANVTADADTPEGDLTFEVSLDYEQDLNGNVTNEGNWITLQDPPGTDVSIAVDAAGAYGADLNQLGEPWVRARFTSTFSGNGVQTLRGRADVASDLNSTYFLLHTPAATTYYVWFNVASAGVNPLVPGAISLPVAISANATGTTVEAAVSAAINSIAGADFTSAIALDVWTVTNDNTGPFLSAEDSTAAPTDFTFTVTTPDTRISMLVSGKAI